MDQVGICNVALGLVGAELIVDLDAPGNGAKLCKANWAMARDRALQERDWSFAIKRFTISTPDVATPAHGFERIFKLPAEVLQVREVLGTDGQAIEWAAEGRTILCDEAAIDIRALVRVEDTSTWSPAFCQAVAYLLASLIVVGLTENERREIQLVQLYERAIKTAGTMDGMQGRGQVPRFQSNLKATRY